MSVHSQALHHQFQKMELKKQEILRLMQSMSPEQLQYQPDPESWSIGQIAHHLYLSERNSLAYLKKKLSYPDTVPPYHPKSWGAVWLIRLVFLLHIKIKAPDSINMWKIGEVMSNEELKDKWDTLRTELISFIEKNEPAFGSLLAFRHPFAGRMTMYQMLIFFNDHIRHHQLQISRIRHKLSRITGA